MKITFELNEIDYGALVEQFLPLVRDKLAEKDGTVAAILSKVAGTPPSIAAKMVDVLPQETKDELAVMLVNKNKERVIETVMEYAAQKGLSFRIDDFEVE